MANARCRTICRVPSWNKNREGVGLEHLLLEERVADSVVLAFDEEHGLSVLTDGAAVLGTGFHGDVRPYAPE